MSSTNTYIEQNSTPYFYIIQHKITKKMYAGSRWKIGCNPEEFMKPNGYQTSSPIIKSIIKEEGLDIFEILRIDTNCDGIHVYYYESTFLQTIDCAKSDDWYNGHNNTNHKIQTPEIKLKIKTTRFNNNNGKYKSPQELEKTKHTCIEKYTVENCMQNPEIYKTWQNSIITSYGVSHTSKISKICVFCKELKNIRHESKCAMNPNRYIYAKTNKLCKFCGEYKNSAHENKCKENPNRKLKDQSGKNNLQAKTYKILNINSNMEYIITGALKKFCTEHKISYYNMKQNKVVGWTITEIAKL